MEIIKIMNAVLAPCQTDGEYQWAESSECAYGRSWEACGGTLMGASNMAEDNFIRDELYSHLQATLAMSGAIFIRDSLGMEAIPDELASLIREWASGDVRTMDEIPAKIRGYFQIKEEE